MPESYGIVNEDNGSTKTTKKVPILRIALCVVISVVLIALASLVIAGIVLYYVAGSGQQCRLPPPAMPEENVVRSGPHIILNNVNLIVGDGTIKEGVSIEIINGNVKKISTSILSEEGATVIDLQGQIVTPGIVDTHSHLGVYGFPEVWARADGNEMTDPTLPQVRAIDAFDPLDPAIEQTMKGGVTTAQILPGSGNVMGGEATFMKLAGKTVEDMRIKNAPRSLKMACGENPKRVYGVGRKEMPMSRMGIAWEMRKKFEEARALMYEQDKWDCDPLNADADLKDRPNELRLEGLVNLLRKKVVLNIHCYEVEDFETLIRLSKEFDFKISTFHHALYAYKVPDIIRENNITVATFADLYGFKMEAYAASVHAPKILYDAGVKLVLKSDHPVTHSKDLIQQAQRSHYYGLDEQAAIISLTSQAAKAINLGDRVGRVEEGLEADIVVWDRNPLMLAAKPRMVLIDGRITFRDDDMPIVNKLIHPLVSAGELNQQCDTLNLTSYAVTGTINDGSGNTFQSLRVVNGYVDCLAADTSCTNGVPAENQYNAGDKTQIVPGFVEASAPLGLIDIQSEDSTNDGVANYGSYDPTIRAVDGIKMRSKPVVAAFKAGVTMAIVPPLVNGMVQGEMVAYYTNEQFVDDGLIADSVGLYITIGNDAKVPGIEKSVSGQISKLRSLLSKNEGAFAKVKSQSIPLVARVYDADNIQALLRVKTEFNINLVIIGGAQAHLLATKLAANQVSVIITPNEEGYINKQQWQTQDTTDLYGAKALAAAGVKFAIGTGSIFNTRNQRWQGGYLAELSNISEAEALQKVTTTVADIFGLSDLVSIATGRKANFVLLNGNALTYEGKVKLVAVGQNIKCNPIQF